jgi:hypothetical protein
VVVVSGKNRLVDRDGDDSAYANVKTRLHQNNGYVKRKESVGDTDVYVIVVNEAHLSYAISDVVHDDAFRNRVVSAGPGSFANRSRDGLSSESRGREDFYRRKPKGNDAPREKRTSRSSSDRIHCRTEPSGGLDGGYRNGYFSWALDRIDSRENALDGQACFFGNPRDALSEENVVDVYVLDTGIQDHPSFARRVSYDYSYYDANSMHSSDCNGHGTHVGGLIASSTYGVSPWNVQLHSVKVLDCEGDGDFASMLSGLTWISNNLSPTRKSVINLSLGSDGGFSSAVANLIESLVEDRGVFVVASAGNYGKDDCEVFPANLPSVISVGATDENDERADFSNYGGCTTVFAPGTNVISCSNRNFDSGIRMSGTSMAAPVVSGALANWVYELSLSTSPASSSTSSASFASPSTYSMRKTIFSKFSSNRIAFESLKGSDGRSNTPNEMIYVGDSPDSNPPRGYDGGVDGRSGDFPGFSSSSTKLSVNVLKALVALLGIYVISRETSVRGGDGWRFAKRPNDVGKNTEDREDRPALPKKKIEKKERLDSRGLARDVGWYVGLIGLCSLGIKMRVDGGPVDDAVDDILVSETSKTGIHFVKKVIAMGQLLYDCVDCG